MKNRDITSALRYHQLTKHSEISVRTSAHFLDWENRPFPFKVYHGLPSIPLPKTFPSPQSRALESISGRSTQAGAESFGISELAELLFFSAGLTRRVRHGGEIHYMRAASATGALYPIELYVVCQDIRGLKAGVYHFSPLDFALVQIRGGDYRAELAAVSEESVSYAPVTIAFTSLAWRNAWKYQARSYRHWFWDGGVIAANTLAVSASMRLRTRLVAGFVDASVNQLLGLKEGKEASVFLAPVGLGLTNPDDRPLKEVPPVDPGVRPLSRKEVEHPEIWELHRNSALSTPDELRDWVRRRPPKHPDDKPSGPIFQLESDEPESPARRLADVILQRGSTRRFSRAAMKFSQLSTILKASTGGLPLDFLENYTGHLPYRYEVPPERYERGTLIDIYVIANAVDGLPSGSYTYHAKEEQLEQLKMGQLRRMSGYLCLEQSLFGDASVVFFLVTGLGEVLEVLGNRGYRAAQLEGGIIAGRVYLSAYALGLGASGTTFYDDAVTEFFSPHAKDKSTMIAVGVGVPAYKARPGKVLPQFS